MLDNSLRSLSRKKAWQQAVSFSASFLVRDEGPGAHLAARIFAREASAGGEMRRAHFWRSVASEIDRRSNEF